ncbi:MAG: electron transfer flavoprotein subunit beta/FixA family protein [Acidimicrobiia bacterium]|nr:electron transfer flavoprotein subunit beta/FixA family protein [Acidimicrobiia bacterium]
MLRVDVPSTESDLMRIVVCVKEVLDPDAVGAYALAGSLVIGDDGKTLTQTTIPTLMNAYDEQAIEAALRIREAGVECTITVVSIGEDATTILRHAVALGADTVVAIPPPAPDPDCHAVSALLSAYVRSSGGADLVLCGRQASDDDQGVVPAFVAESLGVPLVDIARSVTAEDTSDPQSLRVTRVTPDGDEIVRVACPAVVTVSSELGEPRYPTMPMRMSARRVEPEVVTADELGLSGADLEIRVGTVRQTVPTVKGDCEFITGDTPADIADRLVARLVEDRVLQQK